MPKTKTLGIRAEPQLIADLERLKENFGFISYGEMLVCLVRLLQGVDEGICQIKKHPREWGAQEFEEYLFPTDRYPKVHLREVQALLWRRLRQKFGEDGVQHVKQILEQAPKTVGRKQRG